MALYSVCYEINVGAKNPTQAAEMVQSMMDDADSKWQFYVQAERGGKIFSIDLDEHRSLQKQLVTNYTPIIKTK